MDFNLFQEMIKNVSGKESKDDYFSKNVQKLNDHYSHQLETILQNCNSLNFKIIDSTAKELLREQWLSEGKCMHCGQVNEMYDAYVCLNCNLRMYPNLDRDQKDRANQIIKNRKKYSNSEIDWAGSILNLPF